MAKARFRFGIAGFGRHAAKRLMPGFDRSRHCEVSALSRRDTQLAAASAREFSIPAAFASTEAMCRSDQVDAVFVSSPDSIHLADVLTALAHGKHVLCEKPMGMNAGECRQMLGAASSAGLVLGTAQVFRFAASVRHARATVTSGRLGSISQARSEFHYWNEGHGRSWISDPSLACGGPMADVGIHCIDALRFILQEEVLEVSTTASSDERSLPFEASALISLRFASGVLAEVGVSTRAQYRSPLEIVGSQGVLRADDCLSVDFPVLMNITDTSAGAAPSVTFCNDDAFRAQVDAFAEAAQGGAPFPCSGEEGLRNQLVLDAAYRSWRSGRREMVTA